MISAQQVKELRLITGAGMMDCKRALEATKGDQQAAIKYLREKGLAKAAKRGTREASQGIVDSYIHLGGKIGVLIEVNCETDFVARNEEFRTFVRDLCLQVAATNPLYLSKEDVSPEILEKEKDILRKQALNEGKPEAVVEKIVSGRLEKYLTENCLLEQPFVKNPDQTVGNLLLEEISKIGENIIIRRFIRYELGEGHQKKKNTCCQV